MWGKPVGDDDPWIVSLRATWPNIEDWHVVGPGQYAGRDLEQEARHLVVVRPDGRWVTALIDERYADQGLQMDKLAWMERNFEDLHEMG